MSRGGIDPIKNVVVISVVELVVTFVFLHPINEGSLGTGLAIVSMHNS